MFGLCHLVDLFFVHIVWTNLSAFSTGHAGVASPEPVFPYGISESVRRTDDLGESCLTVCKGTHGLLYFLLAAIDPFAEKFAECLCFQILKKHGPTDFSP